MSSKLLPSINENPTKSESDPENQQGLVQESFNDLEERKNADEEGQDEDQTPDILTPENKNIISLQLGDVIRLEDPTNEILNENTFIIDYIDQKIIKLINIADLQSIQLKIDEDGIIAGGTITTIDLLFRNDKLGYARQNNLLPETWINIYFGGDTPVIITGEITNLEEDMIEITVFPDKDVLYINFGYKGIPEDLPIEAIEVRNPPEGSQKQEVEEEAQLEKPVQLVDYEKSPEPFVEGIQPEEDYDLEENERMASMQFPVAEPRDQKKEFIIRADEIHFGRELGPIKQFVNVDLNQQRFTIDTQTNDLLDMLLSKIPNAQRTTNVFQ